MTCKNIDLLRSKGWTLKSLGERWNLGERQMSRVVESESQRDRDAFNGLPDRVMLKITHHPSGRSTLMYKDGRVFRDYKENGLFCNQDTDEFNAAVESKIIEFQDQGKVVDCQVDGVLHPGLMVVFTDDGASVLTTLSKRVFIDAKLLSDNKLELTLRQRVIPTRPAKENHKYIVSIKPFNGQLLKCLEW